MKPINQKLNFSFSVAVLASISLYGCGGGGTSATLGPIVTSVTYAANTEKVQYSDGSIVNKSSISSSTAWANDHVTQTITYSFQDGTTNSVVTTVPGVVGSPNYNGNTQTIVTTYGDGITATATNNATSAPVTWASDHVTKTTTYNFANGGTNPVVTTVPGVAAAPTYAAGVQTIVTTFGDGTTATATNNATSNAVTWASDHVTKTTTYNFANGGTNPVVTTVPGTAGTPSYSGGVQTIVTTYGDGTTATATNNATSNAVTWASDHVTKTTTYTFANGGTNPVVTTVPGTAGTPTYSAGVQTIVTTFGDGTTATATNNATSNAVTWASDHVTKTTTYTFANGATNPVVTTVPGTAGTPTYVAGVQTIVTTYGDGTTATATNNATSNAVTWASDHVTKTTTYTFANGGTNPVVTTVLPTTSNPNLTAANYPANWTTTGTVTPPSVSNSVVTYGDGYTITQDGTASKYFWQSTLSRNSISDPSAFVYSTTTLYDLRWGIPDKIGPTYSADFGNGSRNSITLTAPVTYWGQILSGQCSLGPVFGFCLNGPTIGTPHPEVLSAWQQGWTGKGVNVMMEDSLTQAHGATTTLLAQRYAIGATFYGYNYKTNTGVFNLDGAIVNPTTMVNIGVVNASYGANLPLIIGHAGPWTDAELANAATATISSTQSTINRFTGVTALTNFNYTSSVIVKAAGNDSITADKEPWVKALASNSTVNPRLLVVGAITAAGFTNAPATISSYSNTAGTNSSVASRFLVASGTTPFGTGDLALNGVPISATTSVDPNGVNLGNVGTSYAAPRVAGYVAIVQQKFPNLDAVKASSIMLDTARTDTLTCYPNCDPAIYGKGEASLSRALAPVGRLR